MMNQSKIYITAPEMAEMLGISVGHAYKIIRGLNQELKDNGYIVIARKVPTEYLKIRGMKFKPIFQYIRKLKTPPSLPPKSLRMNRCNYRNRRR